MRHCAKIGAAEVKSDCEFIVYGPADGKRAEASDYRAAAAALADAQAQAKQWNTSSDCLLFKWNDRCWKPVASLYDLQEVEVTRNPGCEVDYQ